MKTKYFVVVLVLNAFLLSCKKEWLDAKPDISLTVPSTIKDYQALLDNSDNIFNINYPTLGEIGTDDYYIAYNNWQSLYTATEKNAYIWASDIYNGETNSDWNGSYSVVYNANIAIDGIRNIEPDATTQNDWNNVLGSALFYRSLAFYNLAQLFAKPYDASTAADDAGIPLRLTSDVNDKSVRASVEQTYTQITNDLAASIPLLPVIPLHKSRPSKPSAYALLARTYLSMDKYHEAYLYADSCLQLYNTLIDYNTLDTTLDYPVPIFNDEDMFHAWGINYYIFFPSNLIVDSTLYNSYNTNDLRHTIFFANNAGAITFRGSYTGLFIFYTGIATDEVYLIRAEAAAREGNVSIALNDLNALLEKRYRQGTFVPVATTNGDELLRIILQERRKELLFRSLRWTDLRRLNKDARFAITLTRKLNNDTYTLPPGDARYVLPIPQEEIEESGIAQNQR